MPVPWLIFNQSNQSIVTTETTVIPSRIGQPWKGAEWHLVQGCMGRVRLLCVAHGAAMVVEGEHAHTSERACMAHCLNEGTYDPDGLSG